MQIEITDKSPEVYWPFLTIISGEGTREKFTRVLEKRPEGKNVFDICLTINGESFDFCEFIRRYEDQLDQLIKEKAFELVQDKFNELYGKLNAIRENLEGSENEVKFQLGVRNED